MEKRENKTLRLVLISLLTIAVLLIAGAFIRTMARYATVTNASDTAVVAHFGFGMPTSIDLFSDSYTNVQADTDGKKLIAPGTAGNYSFEVTGTSEVAYRVSANVEVLYSAGWDGYEPLEFSIDGINWTDIDEFEADLAEALSSNDIEPNSPYNSTQSLYWRWPFFVSVANDILDTQMGVIAAEGTAPGVTVNIEVNAIQVD